MLQVPRLDGDDYESIFARAKARIPTLTDQWTNFNDADPGITTLQAFAWLHDTLHYYMNAAGEVHKRKYFKLLGLSPAQHRARCVLALEGDGMLDIPAGMRVWAGQVPFEAAEAFRGPANRLTAVYCGEADAPLADRTAQAGVDGAFAPLFGPGSAPGARLCLAFARPLEGSVRLYLELAPQPRTPFDEHFSLARLGWEYWDGAAWQPAQVQRDETCGLLRSGFVSLTLPGAPAPVSCPEGLPAGAWLRCTLLENHYDAAPALGRVLPCCVQAVQQRTWAWAHRARSAGEAAWQPPCCAGPDTLAAVAVRGEGEEEFTLWRGFAPAQGDRARVELPAGPGRLTVHFEAPPAPGSELLAMALSPAAADMALLGVTDGCAGLRLNIDAENLCGLTLALLRREEDGRTRCQLWRPCEDLMEAGWDDCVFWLDEANRQVVFGDSLHGRQPEAGWQVMAVELRTSCFEGGNVLAGSACAVEGTYPHLAGAFNPAPAAGGSRRKTSAQLERDLDELLSTPARAVTSEDYRAIALATPGLMLDSVAVIPMGEYAAAYGLPAEENCVVVAAKPRSDRPLPALSEAYRRAIQAHLERARILTTHIRVVPARYVGVSVYGRLRLRPGVPGAPERVRQVLREAVETVSGGRYGRGVDYGRLFSALELEPCVQGVEQLSLEYIGRGGGKNEHGDITAGPDCLVYLREIGLEYI